MSKSLCQRGLFQLSSRPLEKLVGCGDACEDHFVTIRLSYGIAFIDTDPKSRREKE